MQGSTRAGVLPTLTAGLKFDVAMLANIGARGHNALLGLKFVGVSDDWIELAIPWNEALVADEDSGILASGPIISLMDVTSGMAVWKRRGEFVPLVTVDLRVDYMRPAKPHSAVTARVECYKQTRSIAFVRGIAYDETPDDPVAHVAGTFMSQGVTAA